MRILAPIFCALLLLGCASNKDAYKAGAPGHIKGGSTAALHIGMTKDEILKIFGLPQTVSAEGNTELLYYMEELPWWNWKRIRITLVDGKVTKYGQD